MIDYQIISEPDRSNRIEFEYAYVWVEPRSVIDARFLMVNSSRDALLYNIRVMTYKLMAINSNIGGGVGVDDIVSFISKKIQLSVKEYGLSVSVFIDDIRDIVEDCFQKDAPRGMSIVTNSKIEWKRGITELLTLTTEERDEYSRLSGQEANRYMLNIKSKRKMEYANKIISEATQMDIIVKIESAIEAIKSVPHDARITRGKISEVSGISYKTVCKYLEAIPQLKDAEVVDGRTEAAMRVNDLLEDASVSIHNKKEKITKMKLHRESNVSRPTIDKKLRDRQLRLKEYIDILNNKL